MNKLEILRDAAFTMDDLRIGHRRAVRALNSQRATMRALRIADREVCAHFGTNSEAASQLFSLIHGRMESLHESREEVKHAKRAMKDAQQQVLRLALDWAGTLPECPSE